MVEAINVSQAIIEFDPDGKIIRANKNFLAAVGYAEKDVIGQHHRLFCLPEYVQSENYSQLWRGLAAGQFTTGEFKRVGAGGKILWLQASYNPVRDRTGKVVRIVELASDITEAKAKSLDHAGKVNAIERAQAVIEFAPGGEILTANDNFLKTMGYSLDEVVGQHHRMFCESHYSQSKEYNAFWEALRNGEFQAAEYKRIGKGGREVYIQASYNPVFDDTGVVIKVVKFATDITETVMRLRNDELGRHINEQLQDVTTRMVSATEMASTASSASTETGSVVHAVAAASEELSASVREIASSMGHARTSVEGIFKHAEGAGSSARALNDSATSMTSVVEMIQDIASQINLLALNATIESARAGEAGRGFAVVASEVKSLANQAARSTETISKEITNMQTMTTEVVEALRSISSNMTSVLENVSSIASAIEQQNAVSAEISGNMQAAVMAVQEIDEKLNHLTTTFGEVTQASNHVMGNVEALVA
ncbi:PAS domain-containing methyl-accepting chemotaxis protein [Asticcacaulis sp. SL142]|uniref:methyl-accepting chemotaxis protein n=1 Tax=Asticcacaulis sp. SL142 TaxID=2995155 RepID=UPI00226C6B1F|nr:PAS domain-containing methyl-accepting chemotaxis protein [Asticcacaulis sp. SL142]WAC49419.1 PAS domain-containing methyl-accepting chemotaxis protein [Asticcacaulis sp. SL142]